MFVYLLLYLTFICSLLFSYYIWKHADKKKKIEIRFEFELGKIWWIMLCWASTKLALLPNHNQRHLVSDINPFLRMSVCRSVCLSVYTSLSLSLWLKWLRKKSYNKNSISWIKRATYVLMHMTLPLQRARETWMGESRVKRGEGQ